MTDDDLGERIIGCAITVYSALGPGPLESVYEACLVYELSKASIEVARQVSLPIQYEDVILDRALKDLLVGNFNVQHMRDGIRRVVNG